MDTIINTNSMTGFIQEAVLSEVTDCLRVAGKHQGRVFGDYVVNVIVPRLTSSTCDIHFNEALIWFTDAKNSDSFITELGLSLIEYDRFADYRRYYLVKSKTKIANISIYTSPTLQGLSNVDYLTYLYGPSGEPKAESFSHELVQTLIKSIQDKRAIILPTTIEGISTDNITMKFIQDLNRNGWKLSYLTDIPKDVSIEWIKKNLQLKYCTEQPYVSISGGTSIVGGFTCDNKISSSTQDAFRVLLEQINQKIKKSH